MKNAVPLWPQAPCLKARFPPHRFQRLRNSSETEDRDKNLSVTNQEGYLTVNMDVDREDVTLVVIEQDVEDKERQRKMIHCGPVCCNLKKK